MDLNCEKAALFRTVYLFIIDKLSNTSDVLEILHDLPFGGKVFLFDGDFRKRFPIVHMANDMLQQIVAFDAFSLESMFKFSPFIKTCALDKGSKRLASVF